LVLSHEASATTTVANRGALSRAILHDDVELSDIRGHFLSGRFWEDTLIAAGEGPALGTAEAAAHR
jgi:hypothetical protein